MLGLADVAPGARAAATEARLTFLPFGSEAFDLALPRNIWFRRLFQDLLGRLQSGECRQIADLLGGYDFAESGDLVGRGLSTRSPSACLSWRWHRASRLYCRCAIDQCPPHIGQSRRAVPACAATHAGRIEQHQYTAQLIGMTGQHSNCL